MKQKKKLTKMKDAFIKKLRMCNNEILVWFKTNRILGNVLNILKFHGTFTIFMNN